MKKFQISWKYLILLFIFKVSAYPSIYSNHNFLHNNNNNNQKNENGRNLALNGIDFRTLEELKFPSNILEYLDLSEYNQNLNFKQQQQQQQQQEKQQKQNEQQQEKQLNQRRHKILNVQNWPISSIIHDLKSIRSQKHLFANKHNINDNDDDDDDDDDDDNDDISTTNMLSKLMIFGKELYKEKIKRNEKQNDDQDKMISIKDYNSNENNYINANENLNIIDDNKDLITDTDNHNINYEINMKKLNCLSRLHNNSIEICENFQDQKHNTFKTIMKREKIKSSRQTQFIPSISVGAMNNLGNFFDNLKHNVDILEKNKLTEHEEKLLEGDHIISTLRKQLLSYNNEDDNNNNNNNNNNIKPAGTAAFLHAVRTYRPSSRIRALVSMQPDGYHGSNFLDPNYMWLGLGK